MLNLRRAARPLAYVLALTGALAVLAGCGSSKSGSPATSASAPSSTTTTARRATGAPIVLAMANQEGTPAGSYPNMREAVQAGIAYINGELGGVGGRPLTLLTCATTASPESSASCANRLVQQHPVAIIGGLDYTPFSAYPIYEQANLPIIGGEPLQPADMTTKNAYRFTGGPAAGLSAVAAYAAQVLHARAVSVLYPDDAPGKQVYNLFSKPPLEASGIAVKAVPASDSTPDLTAPMTLAAQGADAIEAITTPAQCASALQTYINLHTRAKLLITAGCFEPRLIAQLGPAANGIFFHEVTTESDPGPNKDLYDRVMKRYGPADYRFDDVGGLGFTTIMNFYDVLKQLGPDHVTSASIIDAMKRQKDAPNFFGHPYTCDGRQIPRYPAICDAWAHVRVLENGRLVSTGGPEWVDGARLLG